MDEIIKQIEQGEFEQGDYYLSLRSGKHIWTANGRSSLGFYPKAGAEFSFSEKNRLWGAIKRGRIVHALKSPNLTGGKE